MYHHQRGKAEQLWTGLTDILTQYTCIKALLFKTYVMFSWKVQIDSLTDLYQVSGFLVDNTTLNNILLFGWINLTISIHIHWRWIYQPTFQINLSFVFGVIDYL